MAKKFINPDWKALRKLKSELRQAFFYCWDKSDAVGVYEYDGDYLKTDLGFEISFEELLQLPKAERLCNEKLYFSNYISVNYTALKEGYNPHKPAFRELSKHGLRLNSSLNEINSSLKQACGKLEEEDEEEDNDISTVIINKEVSENFKTFPDEQNIKMVLPGLKMQAAKELLAGLGQQGISEDQIKSLWESFKIQHFTGKKFYQDEADTHRHFLNTLKTQRFIPSKIDPNQISYVSKMSKEENKW